MNKQIKNWEETQEKKITELTNLEDCYSWLKSVIVDYKEFASQDENTALSLAHHGLGTWIRNTLELWADCGKKQEERTKLTQWFNEKGIYHPDDISSIILTSFHRHLNDKKIKIKKQIKKYRKHWDKHQPSINEGKMK